ncbi:hypothetical protein C8Q74DRAFT_1313652 [Fomes fomentarius]|nr:hypothetical protein C8Q74DRAFT_1313652 [Fomes fomentarius]
MPSSHKDARHAALYKPLKKRMIENGDWDRISARLARELNESGWIDRFKDRSKGMRYPGESLYKMARNGGISVEALMTELLPLAEEEIPMQVRQEIIGLVRKLLERQIEFT